MLSLLLHCSGSKEHHSAILKTTLLAQLVFSFRNCLKEATSNYLASTDDCAVQEPRYVFLFCSTNAELQLSISASSEAKVFNAAPCGPNDGMQCLPVVATIIGDIGTTPCSFHCRANLLDLSIVYCRARFRMFSAEKCLNSDPSSPHHAQKLCVTLIVSSVHYGSSATKSCLIYLKAVLASQTALSYTPSTLCPRSLFSHSIRSTSWFDGFVSRSNTVLFSFSSLTYLFKFFPNA